MEDWKMISSGSAGRRYRVQSSRGNPLLHAPPSALWASKCDCIITSDLMHTAQRKITCCCSHFYKHGLVGEPRRQKWRKHPLQTYLFGCRNFPLIIVYKKQTVILWSHWLSTDDGEKKHKFYKYDARIHSALLKVIWVLLNSSSIHRNSKPKKTTEMGSLQLRFCLVSNFEDHTGGLACFSPLSTHCTLHY